MAFIYFMPGLAQRSPVPSPVPADVRSAFHENGELRLQVFPDPELKAGQAYGYVFHFPAPFDELEGKELDIEATHLATNQSVTAVHPVLIDQPSSGYAGLERFTASFALPLAGLWRYEVRLDGSRYADVVLEVGEPDWTPSPEFRAKGYDLTGIPGTLGFINPGFAAGSGNKYMWFFLDEHMRTGDFEVWAVRRGGSEAAIKLFGGRHNAGADRMPSSMTLPEPGVWQLLPYLDGQFIGSITVEVQAP